MKFPSHGDKRRTGESKKNERKNVAPKQKEINKFLLRHHVAPGIDSQRKRIARFSLCSSVRTARTETEKSRPGDYARELHHAADYVNNARICAGRRR